MASPGSGPSPRVGRSYTRGRRYPWVIGKIQGWTIPFGPYTATQLGVLLGGLWLLVQTHSLWIRLGPLAVPIVAMPGVAAWAIRHAKIEGRSPLRALAGIAAQLTEPRAGRTAGRITRRPATHTLHGSVRIHPPPHSNHAPARDRPAAGAPAPTALQALLASAREGA